MGGTYKEIGSQGNTYKVLDGVSMSTSQESSAVDVSLFRNWSCHFSWSGTPVGSLSVDTSPDGTYWTTISGSQRATGGLDGSHVVNFAGSGFRFIKTSFARTSGSGSLTAFVTGN
jgi:hypothetical protein